MPELPEVETVLRGLIPHMQGEKIDHALQRRKDLRWPLPPRFAQRLTGRLVMTMTRRGKYLLLGLDAARPSPKTDPTPETLLIHLGMSGRLFISEPSDEGTAQNGASASYHHALGEGDAARKHDHIVMTMTSGTRITYNDARRFGAMDLWPSADLANHRLLRNLGLEPLSDDLDRGWLIAHFAGRRSSLKAALLDQRMIAGLGNIYVCEALHRSRLSPMREAGSLSPAEALRLVKAIKEVLSAAIAAGGSSLRDFHGATGELGYFQHGFAVYDREDRPCPRKSCSGWIRRQVQNGRSTFACFACQK